MTRGIIMTPGSHIPGIMIRGTIHIITPVHMDMDIMVTTVITDIDIHLTIMVITEDIIMDIMMVVTMEAQTMHQVIRPAVGDQYPEQEQKMQAAVLKPFHQAEEIAIYQRLNPHLPALQAEGHQQVYQAPNQVRPLRQGEEAIAEHLPERVVAAAQLQLQEGIVVLLLQEPQHLNIQEVAEGQPDLHTVSQIIINHIVAAHHEGLQDHHILEAVLVVAVLHPTIQAEDLIPLHKKAQEVVIPQEAGHQVLHTVQALEEVAAAAAAEAAAEVQALQAVEEGDVN